MSTNEITRYLLAGFAVGAFALAVLVDDTKAQSATEEAPKECFKAPLKLSDKDIDAFLANPKALLGGDEVGGVQLSNKVYRLAGSDARVINALIALSADANALQMAAIGSGLARVVRSCSVINVAYASLLQETLAELEPGSLLTAFQAGLADVATAATGSPAGGVTTFAAAPSNLVPGSTDVVSGDAGPGNAPGFPFVDDEDRFVIGNNSTFPETVTTTTIVVSPTN